MPDKSAQHETRTWFEEPLRAHDGDGADGSAAERANGSEKASPVTDDPSAGWEPNGNGETRPLVRPKPEPESTPEPESASESPSEAMSEAEPDAVTEPEVAPPPGLTTEPDAETQPEPAAEPLPEPVAESVPEPVAESVPEPVAESRWPAAVTDNPEPPEPPESSAAPEPPVTPEPPGGAESAERPAAREAAGSKVEAGSEATMPAQPVFARGVPEGRDTLQPPGSQDDPAPTVVIPVVPDRSEPRHRHRHHPQHAAAQQPRFARPVPENSADSTPTTEIPRIRATGAASSWPTAERTQPRLPRPEAQPVAGPPDPPHHNGGARHSGSGGGAASPWRLGGIVAAVVLGLLALGYGIDVATSRGEVPRGVAVAGVDVGGLQRTAAEQRLREQIEPRLTRPITVRAGDVDAPLIPDQAGLTLDWPGTLDQAGTQPLNPWTRFVSLFTTREVGVVTNGDRNALTAALEGLRPQIDRESVEGTIRFEGARPIPVDPVAGQHLDLPGATETLLAEWARGGVVQVPVATVPVQTTPEGIRAALTSFVEPAVAGPITMTGEGGEAVLEPEVTGSALRFAPDGKGGLTVTVDNPAVINALAPQLAPTERPGKDAGIVIEGGRPVVQPSAEGRSVDWEKSLQPLPDVLRAVASSRKMPAVYVTKPPKLTTEQAQGLGVTTQISTFTTGGFAEDSGKNIRRAAEQVNGALVLPGETFSLNGYTGPRNAASGYSDAGIIEDGHPARGIGGGVSQFATTLYNASYFAGMVDVEHKEHSYYISRYPAAREATVYEGAIDVKFRNDSPTGILIQTAWSPTSVTVTFWGTKHVNVESIPGPRTDPTDQETIHLNIPHCVNTKGAKGFTTTDTRVIRDAASGAEISRKTRTVRYKPSPRVICEAG